MSFDRGPLDHNKGTAYKALQSWPRQAIYHCSSTLELLNSFDNANALKKPFQCAGHGPQAAAAENR